MLNKLKRSYFTIIFHLPDCSTGFGESDKTPWRQQHYNRGSRIAWWQEGRNSWISYQDIKGRKHLLITRDQAGSYLSVALRDQEYVYCPWMGWTQCCPSVKFAGKNNTQCPRLRLEPGPLNPVASTTIMRQISLFLVEQTPHFQPFPLQIGIWTSHSTSQAI